MVFTVMIYLTRKLYHKHYAEECRQGQENDGGQEVDQCIMYRVEFIQSVGLVDCSRSRENEVGPVRRLLNVHSAHTTSVNAFETTLTDIRKGRSTRK